MPRPTEVAGDAEASISVEQVPSLVNGLRNAFNLDKTRSKAWRIGQLKALDKLLVEGEAELCEVNKPCRSLITK